ncbi:MAG: glycosyltransferase family 2 protein [Bacteriovoracaceae bacterium]|jgi:glycosyltransferase involved in cell wall biosynthesis|nr:glycosyltransferase family 2 protein [Bacteriovoracaceae bacterium]
MVVPIERSEMNLTVTIITFNEELHIERSVKSALFADEVIVVDSNSTDRTVEIAEGLGAKVYQKAFMGYGQQKNYAASLAKETWIFSLDADEEISEELKESIQKVLSKKPDTPLFQCKRLTRYCGKWIYHCGWYPDRQERLFKKGSVTWSTPNVHERLIPNDKNTEIHDLTGHLLHYSFPDFKSQIKTNLNFSTKASLDLIETSPDRVHLVSVMLKPMGKFLESYIFKKGFLDGIHGLFIGINSAHAMFMKYAMAYLAKKEKNGG